MFVCRMNKHARSLCSRKTVALAHQYGVVIGQMLAGVVGEVVEVVELGAMKAAAKDGRIHGLGCTLNGIAMPNGMLNDTIQLARFCASVS